MYPPKCTENDRSSKKEKSKKKSRSQFFFVKSNSVHMKHIKNTFLTPYDLLTSTYLNSWVTSYLVKIYLFQGLRPQRRKSRSQKVEVGPKITNFDTLTPKTKKKKFEKKQKIQMFNARTYVHTHAQPNTRTSNRVGRIKIRRTPNRFLFLGYIYIH